MIHATAITLAFEKNREHINKKDNETRWLLLSTMMLSKEKMIDSR